MAMCYLWYLVSVEWLSIDVVKAEQILMPLGDYNDEPSNKQMLPEEHCSLRDKQKYFNIIRHSGKKATGENYFIISLI